MSGYYHDDRRVFAMAGAGNDGIKFKGDNTPIINLNAEFRHNHWQFKVQDNGIGVSKDFQERIFVIFERLHSQDEYKGTLAECQKMELDKIYYYPLLPENLKRDFKLPRPPGNKEDY